MAPPRAWPADRLRAAAALAEAGEARRSARRGPKAPGERDMLRQRLEALGVVVRDLGASAAGGDARWQSPPDPTPGRPGAAAAARRGWPTAYDAVDEAHQALDRNVSPKTVADWVALEL